MKLLIVDDDPDVRALIERTAPPWLEVAAAGSSGEAMARVGDADTGRPDLVLVDMHLPPHLGSVPELEGIALASWLGRRPDPTPVVLISTHPFPGQEAEPSRPAALGRLQKPLDLTLLYRFLAAWEELFEPDREDDLRDPGALRAGGG